MIREAERPVTRVLTSTKAQTKRAILPSDCVLRLCPQTHCSDCNLRLTAAQTAAASDCTELLPPPVIFLSLLSHIPSVSTSLVLGLKG